MKDEVKISIHALLAESDVLHTVYKLRLCIISIHALLAESDPLELMTVLIIYDFYPRSPCGERRVI